MRRFVVGLAIGIATFAPSWASANDEQIAKTIVEKLEARKKQGQLKGFNIDLKVEKGTVWLSGHVTSAEQQQLALDIARRAEGVEAVVNDLKVKPAATAASTGKPSASRSASRSSEAPKVAESKAAETRPALLSSLFGSSSATKTVAAAPKVDSQVKPAGHEERPAAPSNDALIDVLADRLNKQKELGSLKDFDINLSADQGVVTVSGDVASREQKDLILDTVRRTRGVVKVVNMLQVTSASSASAASEPTPAAVPRPVARVLPQASPSVVPVADSRESQAVGSDVAATARAAAAAADQGPVARTAQVASPNGGTYTAIPVQVVPSPLPVSGGAVPLNNGAPHLAQRPLAFAPSSAGGAAMTSGMGAISPMPAHLPGAGVGIAPARYDHPNMPGYAWPSYAAYPNYAAVSYPKQYSPSAWPYIGPFYPYPQVPLGWRKVTLKWDDGWWFLDFKDK